jgi:signal peptidase I
VNRPDDSSREDEQIERSDGQPPASLPMPATPPPGGAPDSATFEREEPVIGPPNPDEPTERTDPAAPALEDVTNQQPGTGFSGSAPPGQSWAGPPQPPVSEESTSRGEESDEPREAPALASPAQPAPREWDTWTPPGAFRADDGLERYPEPAYVDPTAEPGTQWNGDESDFDSAPHKPSRSRSLVRELVETGLMALLVFLAVRATFQNYRVHGHSMDPNLQDGEFLLVNRIEYAQINIDKLSNFIPFLDPGSDPKRDVFTSPQRGDVIILEDPRQPQGDRLVKRVIGLPGDKLEIVSGTVYINGRLLHEPYIPEPGDYTSPPIIIPPNQFFVMGDNRRNSEDSRYLGLIPRDLIIGKAMIAMWPTDKFGFAPNERPVLDPAVTR